MSPIKKKHQKVYLHLPSLKSKRLDCISSCTPSFLFSVSSFSIAPIAGSFFCIRRGGGLVHELRHLDAAHLEQGVLDLRGVADVTLDERDRHAGASRRSRRRVDGFAVPGGEVVVDDHPRPG